MKMKFLLYIGIIGVFCVHVTLSRDSNTNALQKAFTCISRALSQRNPEVILYLDSAVSNKTNLAICASAATIPHEVEIFKNNIETYLFESTIVSLSSAVSMNTFNRYSYSPVSILMLHYQIFVYCPDGTFDKISMLETSNQS